PVTHPEITPLTPSFSRPLRTEQVIERLDASGIANARINTPDEVWEHQQMKSRDRWREMNSPVGLLATWLPPVTMPDFEARIDPVPALGEHTERILSELGYGSADIVAFGAAGVV